MSVINFGCAPQMPDRKKMAQVFAVFGAVLIGLFLGSYDRLGLIDGAGESATSSIRAPGHLMPGDKLSMPSDIDRHDFRGGETDAPALLAEEPPESETDAIIRAGQGLAFRRAVIDGAFAGYEVVEDGDDSRFKKGRIVVAVGGQAVDDSAAGGELFLAALASGEAELEYLEIAE